MPSGLGQHPRIPARRLLFRLAAMGLALLAAGLAAELLFRLHPPFPNNEQQVMESEMPFFRIAERNGEKVLLQEAQSYASRKKAYPLGKRGRKRIILIGESSARDLGNNLQDALRGEDAVEIVNMAVGGCSLEHVRRRFSEALDYSPDILLLLFGHNLFYYWPRLRDHPRLFAASAPWVKRSRFLSHLLVRLCFDTGDPGILQREHSLRHSVFQECLSDFARRAAEKNVTLILCTVPSNLEYLPEHSSRLYGEPAWLESRRLWLRGKRAAAVRRLADYAAEAPHPLWDFHLGLWLREEGEAGSAAFRLQRAADLDAHRHRATTGINRIIRQAARDHHLPLLDFDALVRGLAKDGVPGYSEFTDPQHVNLQVLSLERRALLKQLLPETSGNDTVHCDPIDSFPDVFHWMEDRAPFYGAEEYENLVYWARAHGKMVAAELARMEEFLPSDPDLNSEIRRHLAEGLWLAGERPAALRLNARAAELSPQSDAVRFQKACFLLQSGQKEESCRQLRETLALNPAHKEASYFFEQECAGTRRPSN